MSKSEIYKITISKEMYIAEVSIVLRSYLLGSLDLLFRHQLHSCKNHHQFFETLFANIAIKCFGVSTAVRVAATNIV